MCVCMMMMWVKVKGRVTGDVMDDNENENERGTAYAGTAGVMLDFSLADGLKPIRSSFSRRVFSWEMILRVAILVVSCGKVYLSSYVLHGMMS